MDSEVKYSGEVPQRNGSAGRIPALTLAKVPFLFGFLDAQSIPGPLLVELLEDLGTAPAAARTLLSRMRERGLLQVEPHGRMSCYRLSGSVWEKFIRIRGDETPPWGGRLHTVLYDVPERDRRIRDRLLAQADRVGYGLLRPGVLVGAWDRTAELAEEMAESRQVGFVAAAELVVPLDEARTLIARALDFDGLAAMIAEQIAQLSAATANSDGVTGTAALRELEQIPRQARLLMGTIAAIPDQLLPDDWPATRLRTALSEFDGARGPAARVHARERIAASKYGDYIR